LGQAKIADQNLFDDMMGDEMNEIWIESDTRYRSYYTEDGMAVNRIRYIRADLVPISCGGTMIGTISELVDALVDEMDRRAVASRESPAQKFAGTKVIAFTRIDASNRIQFWCEELKMSIFFTDVGIEAAGPDNYGTVMLTNKRFSEI
jgi:hypothetical protein